MPVRIFIIEIAPMKREEQNQVAILRWLKKLEYKVSDAPSKSLQRRMGPAVVDELSETVRP